MLRPNGVVVGVECFLKGAVVLLVSAEIGLEDKGLEEPRCMSEMPLCRTSARIYLDTHVLWRKRLAQTEREAADLGIMGGDLLGCCRAELGAMGSHEAAPSKFAGCVQVSA